MYLNLQIFILDVKGVVCRVSWCIHTYTVRSISFRTDFFKIKYLE